MKLPKYIVFNVGQKAPHGECKRQMDDVLRQVKKALRDNDRYLALYSEWLAASLHDKDDATALFRNDLHYAALLFTAGLIVGCNLPDYCLMEGDDR